MRCFHPHTIKVPYSPFSYPEGRESFYRSVRLLGSVPCHFVRVPCGKCPACLRSRQLAWAFRCECEARSRSIVPLFVTLTYSEDHLPENGSLCKDDLTLFLKRLRINFFRYVCKFNSWNPSCLTDLQRRACSLKFIACGEYGARYGRPHFHLCLFSDFVIPFNLIQESWNYSGKFVGRVDIKPFLPSRGAYVAKYSMKQIGFDYGDCEPPFLHVSNGLGFDYLTKYGPSLRAMGSFIVCNSSGRRIPLPRYFRDRIYTPEQVSRHSLEVMFSDFDKSLSDPFRDSCLVNQEKNFIRVSIERLALSRLKSVL